MNRAVKKSVIVGICAFLCIIIVFIVVRPVRPIFPGRSVEILYPGDYAVVPRDFSIFCVTARWSLGLETTPPLFLAPRKSHVHMYSPYAEISVNGERYAVSTEGNHHLVWVSLPKGDHTIRLDAAGVSREMHIRVTRKPDVSYEPLDSVHGVIETTDRLESALYEYIQSTAPEERGEYTFRRIFLTGEGAFIAFYDARDRVPSACEITYLDLYGDFPGTEEIAAAPALFTWTDDEAEKPIIAGALETGGDRLFLTVLDEVDLTVFSVFPGGAVTTDYFLLEDVLGELFGSIAKTPPPEITTHGFGEFLHVNLAVHPTGGRPEEVDLVVSGSTIQKIDLSGYCVEGVYPDGRLIACCSAPDTGPLTTLIFDEAGPDREYFPLPHVEDFLSFTSGSIHEGNRFYPVYPRFEIAPAVPCVSCTAEYAPEYFGVAGDVSFPPEVFRVSIAGIEGYYRMKAGR